MKLVAIGAACRYAKLRLLKQQGQLVARLLLSRCTADSLYSAVQLCQIRSFSATGLHERLPVLNRRQPDYVQGSI
jgi:hypothetical protein